MKISKDVANYTPEAIGARQCGNCAMFHKQDLVCDLVRGTISPSGWCQHWTKAEKQS